MTYMCNELQYIETLQKSCQQNGTWAEAITSECVQQSLLETKEKVLYSATLYTSLLLPIKVCDAQLPFLDNIKYGICGIHLKLIS